MVCVNYLAIVEEQHEGTLAVGEAEKDTVAHIRRLYEMYACGVKVVTVGNGCNLLPGHLAKLAPRGNESHQLMALVEVTLGENTCGCNAFRECLLMVVVMTLAKEPTVGKRDGEDSYGDNDDDDGREDMF